MSEGRAEQEVASGGTISRVVLAGMTSLAATSPNAQTVDFSAFYPQLTIGAPSAPLQAKAAGREGEKPAPMGAGHDSRNLQSHRGDATSPIMAEMTREEIDAKIDASEARNAALIERAMGEVRADFNALRGDINTQFASLRGDIAVTGARAAGKMTVIGTGLTVFLGMGALLAAMLAFGSQWFGLGMDNSQIVQQAAQAAVAEYAKNVPPR